MAQSSTQFQRTEPHLSAREHVQRDWRCRPAQRLDSSRLCGRNRLQSIRIFSGFGNDQIKNGVVVVFRGRSALSLVGFFNCSRPLRSTGWRSLDRLHSDESPAALPDSGGEHFAVRDIGAFAQASYKPHQRVKLVAGWRVDDSHISQRRGFGTVFTPRLGVIYTPGDFRSQGQLRRGVRGFHPTSKGSRRFRECSGPDPNGPLEPEHARNVELSVGRQWGRLTSDVAAYQTTYSNLVTLRHTRSLRPRDRADPERSDRPTRRQDRAAPDLRRYFAFSQAIANALPVTVRGL